MPLDHEQVEAYRRIADEMRERILAAFQVLTDALRVLATGVATACVPLATALQAFAEAHPELLEEEPEPESHPVPATGPAGQPSRSRVKAASG